MSTARPVGSRPGPQPRTGRAARSLVVDLLGAAHPGPGLAVTVLAGLLAVGLGLPVGRGALVVVAVATSQLSIGWSNDLLDVARDRAVGRTDKPLAAGALPPGLVRAACGVVVVVTLPLGFALGLPAGLVHLSNTVAGWAYNLGLKATVWSWVPYAVAFGGLPAYVALAGPDTALPLWSVPAGALLGVGAHLLNVLPDLDDDAATGVRGMPHRLGAGRSRVLAVAVLVLASVVIVAGVRTSLVAGGVALVLVLGLAGLALRGRGRTPFVAAVGIALVDVVLLVVLG